MSNHSDFEYIIQWYGANGAMCATAAAFIKHRRGPGGKRAHSRSGAGVRAERLERFAHGAESIGTGVEHGRTGRDSCTHAHLGEVVGVNELVPVVALAEHEDVGTVGDPFEQDSEDAEAAMAEDRARSNDGDVETVRRRVVASPLGGELGVPVRLDRASAPSSAAPGSRWARRRPHSTSVHDLADAGPGRFLQQQLRAVDVDRAQQLLILRQRNLGDVVEDDVACRRRASPRLTGRGCRRPPSRHPVGRSSASLRSSTRTVMPGGNEPLDEQRSEVAAAASDQTGGRRLGVTARDPARRTSGCCAACPRTARPAGS